MDVAQFDSTKFWLIWTLFFSATLVTFYLSFRYWYRARLIEDVPTARIRSAHQGYVELEGIGQPIEGAPIIAPLSKVTCIWYHYKIEKKEHYHYKGTFFQRWKKISEGSSDSSFYLVDGTGQCVVDPDGSEITMSDKLVWYGCTAWPMAAPLVGTGSVGSILNENYRYTERFILPGQPLYAVGEFKTVRAADNSSVTEISRDLLLEWKRNHAALVTAGFDKNNDGEIDIEEWQAVRHKARLEAEKIHEKQLQKPDIHLLKKPANSNLPFLLSIEPQRKLTRQYRRYAIASLATFLVVGIITIWFLNQRLV